MPAINLPRLKIQSAKLMDKFDDPEEFLRDLHNLFDLYADRTLRKSAVLSPISVLPSHRVSPPVIRQLELELGARAQTDPDHSLVIADRLWEDGYYETRLLAANLLGRMSPGGEAFMERLTAWVSETRDPAISNTLLTSSLMRLRSENTNDFLLLLERWAHPSRKNMTPSVMVALIPLLKDKSFHNLPPVFNIVQPLIETSSATTQQELSALVCALYEASPVETTFFLRQRVTISSRPHTIQNIRRILPTLPQNLQDELREAIRR